MKLLRCYNLQTCITAPLIHLSHCWLVLIEQEYTAFWSRQLITSCSPLIKQILLMLKLACVTVHRKSLIAWIKLASEADSFACRRLMSTLLCFVVLACLRKTNTALLIAKCWGSDFKQHFEERNIVMETKKSLKWSDYPAEWDC